MKKILIIEDESSLQKTFSDLFQGEGYQTISALDGEEGLRSAKTDRPNLILLDLVLPKIHGLDVLRQLKEDLGTKEIPIIILSNLEGANEVERALELGASTYLVKANYTLKEVLDKIKKELGE